MRGGLIGGQVGTVPDPRDLFGDTLAGRRFARPGWNGTGSSTWIGPTLTGMTNAGIEWGGSLFMFCPYDITETVVIDQAAILQNGGATASQTARIALYRANRYGWPSGNAVYDLGTIDNSTAGRKTLSGQWILAPGIWWGALWGSSTFPIYTVGATVGGLHIKGVPDVVVNDGQSRLPLPRPTVTFHASNPFPVLDAAATHSQGPQVAGHAPFIFLRRVG